MLSHCFRAVFKLRNGELDENESGALELDEFLVLLVKAKTECFKRSLNEFKYVQSKRNMASTYV